MLSFWAGGISSFPPCAREYRLLHRLGCNKLFPSDDNLEQIVQAQVAGSFLTDLQKLRDFTFGQDSDISKHFKIAVYINVVVLLFNMRCQ